MYQPHFRCKRNGVPALSNEEIEQDAERFIFDFDPYLLISPDEVDIDEFAELYLGLDLRFCNLTSYGGILGRMIFNDHQKIPIYLPTDKCADYYIAERGEILIDSSLENNEHRVRSTIGHEVGHWIYHQAYYNKDLGQTTLSQDMERGATACRKSDIESRGPKRLVTNQEWLEHQANYFNAALLMPRRSMKLVCEDPFLLMFMYNDFSEENFSREALDFMVLLVAETFNVSEEAARIRIHQLGLEPQQETDPCKTLIMVHEIEEKMEEENMILEKKIKSSITSQGKI